MTDPWVLAVGGDGHSAVHDTVALVVGMLAVAATVGVATKFVRVPYTVALVLVGLLIALSSAVPGEAKLDPDVVLLIFLPPLLFQAGLHTDLDLLRRGWKPVALLALPGVLLSAFLVGTFASPFVERSLGIETGWAVALLVGITMAPTDPITVMAAFKTSGVPDKLKTVVEGESLFNDGTAVALFNVLRAALIAGGSAGLLFDPAAIGLTSEAVAQRAGSAEASLTLGTAALAFVKVAGLGTVFGLGLGLMAFWILRKLEDHALETGITVALAWGSFLLAEEMGASGVIAVVVASLIIGNYGKVLSMSDKTRTTVTSFWDSVDFVVNSILFLLIGLELDDPDLGGLGVLTNTNVLLGAGAIILGLFVARALVVYPAVLLTSRHWPRGWKHLLWFSGLRGSLSMALVLSLPDGPLRDYLAPTAFLVVLFSLVVQSLLMPLVVRVTNASEPMLIDVEG